MSLYTPPNSTNIFELPPILESICNNLLPYDIRDCRLVCKSWALLFEPYGWRGVNLHWPTQYTTAKLIESNSHRIWSLSALMRDLSILLEANQVLCTNLRELLTLGDFYHEEQFEVLYDAHGISDHRHPGCPLAEILKLVSLNPQLHTLEFSTITNSIQPFDYSLLSGFSALQKLTRLALEPSEHERKDPELIFNILKSCPSSLQELRLGCYCEFKSRQYYMVRSMESAATASRIKTPWKPFQFLKSLVIRCRHGECEPWIHVPILRNSPQLNRISIFGRSREVLETASAFCPSIERLHIGLGQYTSSVSRRQEDDFVRLIQAYPRGLKSFHLEVECRTQDRILSALLQTSLMTLESLQVKCGAGISRETIIRILRDCPNLQEFDLRPDDVYPDTGLSLDELLRTPWASPQLSTISISVIDMENQSLADADSVELKEARHRKLATMILDLHHKVKAHPGGPICSFPCMFPKYVMPVDTALEMMRHEITEEQLESMDLRWPSTKDEKWNQGEY
ncbi:hypothetical protein BGZ90_011194 [Linnemannia elongata]|nr:hypothetical protein BGZ90_011194 [Linnemannia elongata]